MASRMRNEYTPDTVSPPGDTIVDAIESLGFSLDEVAELMGCARNVVDELVVGQRPLTVTIAARLADVLGVPASFWSERERRYRDYLSTCGHRRQAMPGSRLDAASSVAHPRR